MAKYKVGDKVRVVPWASLNGNIKSVDRNWAMHTRDRLTTNSFTEKMVELAGKVVTITFCQSQYQIKESNCFWTDDMFLPFSSPLEEIE